MVESLPILKLGFLIKWNRNTLNAPVVDTARPIMAFRVKDFWTSLLKLLSLIAFFAFARFAKILVIF